MGEDGSDEALHVGGAAAVDAPVARIGPERMARPVLALDGNDIGVGGQGYARPVGGPDGRQDGGLVAGGVEDPPGFDTLGREQGDDVLDDVEVRA